MGRRGLRVEVEERYSEYGQEVEMVWGGGGE